MKSVFTRVALPSLLLFILDGSLPLLPALSVKAFPAAAISTSSSETSSAANGTTTSNLNQTITDTTTVVAIGGVTEYPVFISVTEETQISPETAEPEVVTETYMIVEDQEVDDDDDSSTMSPAIVRSTTPMQSPKSSPEQEEVLRELKKLWDLSEGMSDNGNDALKNSLSSIVHLAYTRVYVEPDETLLKLKYLLQQLHERILLGTNLNGKESFSTTTSNSSSSSLSSVPDAVSIKSTSYSTTTNSPKNAPPMTTTASSIRRTEHAKRKRRKRGIYDTGYDDEVEAIFFANVNSQENSVIPEEDKGQQEQQLKQSPNHWITQDKSKHDLSFSNAFSRPNEPVMQLKNDFSNMSITKDPVDSTLLSLSSTVSSTTSVMSVSTTTPSTVVQKVIHIHDRQKPMPSFFLSPERIKELKSRVTSSTTTTTSTLSPFSIAIDDELENEVNLLQQQQNVDNYDIHISSSETLAPLTTATPSNSSFHKKPLSGGSTIIISPSSTTEFPYSAEDIALALFQLLRPDTFDEDESEESVTVQPHPTPSSILYQVGSLSSVLNFTINRAQNISSTSTTTEPTGPSEIKTTSEMPLTSTMAPATLNTTLSLLKLKEKYMTKEKNNSSLVVPPPPALLDLATTDLTISTTERQSQNISLNNDVYDYTDILDQAQAAADQTSITTNIMQGTQESVQQMMGAVSRLSVGAKMVLLFSVSISIISIGFGIFALGPPLTGVGVLGIIIPVGLLLLFETTSGGKRKLTTRQKEQLLISKLQSEEFSKILNMIFDAVTKYSKG